MYKYAMQEVKRTQDFIHAKLAQDVAGIEIAVLALLKANPYGGAGHGGDKKVVDTLTDFVNTRANYVVAEWQKLLPRLITGYVAGLGAPDPVLCSLFSRQPLMLIMFLLRFSPSLYSLHSFHDGMMALDRDQPLITMKRLFYPKWWLLATNYFEHHGNFGPGVILFAPNPTDADAGATSGVAHFAGLLLTSMVSCAVTVAAVMYYLRRQEKVHMTGGVRIARHEYTPINSDAML
jgi:hypothetical protein